MTGRGLNQLAAPFRTHSGATKDGFEVNIAISQDRTCQKAFSVTAASMVPMRLRPVSTCAVARRLALGVAPQLAVALGSLLELSVLEDRERLCQEYGYEVRMHMCNVDGGYCPSKVHAQVRRAGVCVSLCAVI